MTTKTVTSKIQKPKANNFILVLEQFLEKHNLMTDFISEQLSKHVLELDVLLLNQMTHRCVKVALTRDTNNRCSFSKKWIETFLPDKKKEKLTIKKRAKYYVKTGDFIDIVTNHQHLNLKSNDENKIITSTSCQSQFCIKLTKGGINSAIINTFTKDLDLIQESNKIQKK